MEEFEKTLQNLCVKQIVENFEQYFSAFSNTDDAALKRKFEFLQRKYSYEIASLLYQNGRMEAEYVDFVVNKHLKVLDFDWMKNCTWEKIVAKFQEVGSDLQKVHIRDDYFELPLQDLMCHLPNLQEFSFHRYCSDEILKSLGKFCHNIEEIDLSACESITSEGIKHLCVKENGESTSLKLKRLFITCCDVNDEGMVFFMKHMPSIEVLDYNYLPDVLYSIHKKDLPHIDKVKPYNLQNLNMLHCGLSPYYSDILKVCLPVCPHLKSLSCPILKQEHLNIISELSALEKLHLDNNSNSDILINELLELNGRKLHSLSVSLVSLSIFSLPRLCPILKYLHITQVTFKMDCVSSPVFPHLETCIFDSIVYNEESAKTMSLLMKNSPKLEHLAFKRCDVSSSEMKAEILKCCEQKPMTKINFTGTTVDMAFIQDILFNCHSLICMILDNCGLDNDDEFELDKIARLLPNSPDVLFSDELSIGESDEFFSNIYDFEDDIDEYDDYSGYNDDDDDDYDGDYDDYDDDHGDYYGCFFD